MVGLLVCCAPAGEFAGCGVNLGRDEWVWVEALPQPGCLMLHHDCGCVLYVGPDLRLRAVTYAAELCRERFSQSR